MGPLLEGVFKRDGLGFHVLINGIAPQVFSKPGLLEPAKRSSNVSLVVNVDKACASVQMLTDIQGFVDVLGEHAGCQTKLGVVGALHNALNIALREQRVSHSGILIDAV